MWAKVATHTHALPEARMALPAPTQHRSYPMDIATPPGHARAGQYQSMLPGMPSRRKEARAEGQ